MKTTLDLKLSPDVIDSLSRNRCVNRVHVVGRVASKPQASYMSKSLKKTAFSVVLAETWTNRSTGKRMHHLNVVDVEVLGQDSERASGFQVGCWVAVDGYLRVDAHGPNRRTTIRTYSVQCWRPDGEPGDHHGEHEKQDASRDKSVSGEGGPRGVEVLGKGSRRSRELNQNSPE